MKINAYLMFNGQCKEAFTYYAQCLGGTLEMLMPFSDSPDSHDIPAQYHERIMHARLLVGDQVLMGSDSIPPHVYGGIKGCSISLQVDTIAEAQRVYDALIDQGHVNMPLQETFWAERFAMFTDRFGVAWMVNCEKSR